MKITAPWIAAVLSASIAVGQAVLIVHGIGSWWIVVAAVITFSVSSATLWGEVVDR